MRARTIHVALVLMAVLVAAGCGGTPAPGPAEPSVTPSDVPVLTAEELAAEKVAGLTDAQLAGGVLLAEVSLEQPAQTVAALVRDLDLAGVILFNPGGVDAAGVRAYTDTLRAVRPDLLVGTDQEYGFVTRVRTGMVELPSAMAFGAAGRPDLTRRAWQGAGAELAAAGVNINFAPVADVVSLPGNTVIGSRSYGSDPAAVSAQIGAMVTGLQEAGVAATLKHFPGHGNTTVDSHTGLPVLTQSRASLEEVDLAPFKAGIAAGAWLVMSGHLDVAAVDPGVPASFSHKVLTDLLRDELGFTGVAVSDSLVMEPAQAYGAGAPVQALLAGNDLLLMPPDPGAARQSLLDALASGTLPRERLVEAAVRVQVLKDRLGALTQPAVSTLDDPAHRAVAREVAAAAVTVLRGSCTGPLVPSPVRVTASGGRDASAQTLRNALTTLGVTVVASGGSQVHLVGLYDEAGDLAPGAYATVAMDTPYLLTAADSPVLAATYSSSQASLWALAEVIAGRATPVGRSPAPVNNLPASACP